MKVNEAIKKLAREKANLLGEMVIIVWHANAIRFYTRKEAAWLSDHANSDYKELYQVVPEDPTKDREIPSKPSPLTFVVND